eukprot:8950411-Pyramimonas_sp.AAC.1
MEGRPAEPEARGVRRLVSYEDHGLARQHMPPTRCSAGSTEGGPNMASVTGAHSVMLLGVMMAELVAPTGARAPRRPPI